MATGYGPRSSRELCTCAAQCLGSQFAVRGRAGQVAPGAAGLWPALIKRIAHVRGPVPGFSIRGAWPYGTSRARGGGLWPALIKRVAHVRGPVPGFSIRAYGSSLLLVLIERYSARARGVVGRGMEKAGILCGAWPHGTSRAHGGGLWPALIERIAHVRGVWLVGDWKSLAIGEFGRAQCIWVGQNPRAGWGQGAVLGFLAGNRSGPNCFLVSFAQKLDAKNTGIPVKQRERHFAVILVGQGKQFSCIYNF